MKEEESLEDLAETAKRRALTERNRRLQVAAEMDAQSRSVCNTIPFLALPFWVRMRIKRVQHLWGCWRLRRVANRQWEMETAHVDWIVAKFVNQRLSGYEARARLRTLIEVQKDDSGASPGHVPPTP